jgi:lipopolysaccharide export system permease protein
MLFQSSIRKELARSFGATLVVLVTIVMTIMLLHLGQASRGSISPQDVMLLRGIFRFGPPYDHRRLRCSSLGKHSRPYVPRQRKWSCGSGDETGRLCSPLFTSWPVLIVISLTVCLAVDQPANQGHTKPLPAARRSGPHHAAFSGVLNGNGVFFMIDRDLAGRQASSCATGEKPLLPPRGQAAVKPVAMRSS